MHIIALRLFFQSHELPNELSFHTVTRPKVEDLNRAISTSHSHSNETLSSCNKPKECDEKLRITETRMLTPAQGSDVTSTVIQNSNTSAIEQWSCKLQNNSPLANTSESPQSNIILISNSTEEEMAITKSDKEKQGSLLLSDKNSRDSNEIDGTVAETSEYSTQVGCIESNDIMFHKMNQRAKTCVTVASSRSCQTSEVTVEAQISSPSADGLDRISWKRMKNRRKGDRKREQSLKVTNKRKMFSTSALVEVIYYIIFITLT